MIKNYTKILENITVSDQKAIQDFYDKKISETDLNIINSSHLSTLKEIIKEIGFPTIQKTSKSAYTAAIIVLLHCSDIGFLDKMINSLENYKEGEIIFSHKAYLIDKSRVLKNLPQIYGTQYKKDSLGKITFLPILNPENVDSLRKEIGLELIQEYKNKIS